MISILLYLAISYLLFNSVIFWMNRNDFTPLRTASASDLNDKPLVSICIPARNEEHNIARALDSLLRQSYSPMEVLVLDDQSTDKTSEILQPYEVENPELIEVIDGSSKPDSWLGKSWACHQLSEEAHGDILFFIDADVWLHADAVTRTLASMQYFNVDFITIWPIQQMETFWEQVVIPLIYYGLLTLLPVRYVHRNPAWLPDRLASRISPEFAAACGQCMVFKRDSYKKIDGHRSVKNHIVEDVALAKRIKRKGYSMHMFHGREAAYCRMYRSGKEMWNGFRKNFLGLFGDSVPAFISMALVNFVVYVLPFLTILSGIARGNSEQIILSVFAILIIFTQRLLLAEWFGWSKMWSYLHPLAVLWFHALGIRVLYDHWFGRRAEWKNRPTS